MQLTGLHHLTAVTADAPGNHRFYTRTLGMRLVKKTVNQDDVSAYHLFYADGIASPGSDITFFDWPVARERRGTHSISRTGLRVPGAASLACWSERLRELGVRSGEIDGARRARDARPRGRRGAAPEPRGGRRQGGAAIPWRGARCRPSTRSAASGRSASACPTLRPTDAVLTAVMGMRAVRGVPRPDGAARSHVYEMGAGGAAAELHVAVEPGLAGGRSRARAACTTSPSAVPMPTTRRGPTACGGARMPSSGPVDRF